MSLETTSKALKDILATYKSDWLLGDLVSVIHAGKERAGDQLGELSSPMRQLYYLAGLNVTSDPGLGDDMAFRHSKWGIIVSLLNEIEIEYAALFNADKPKEMTEEWVRVRSVAVPSFLAYFNQGPLNYEEQVINWVTELFTSLDATIEAATGLKAADFLQFYQTIDHLHHINFQAHAGRKNILRTNWQQFVRVKGDVPDDAPDFIQEMGREFAFQFSARTDPGQIDRFFPSDLVSAHLPLEKVNTILTYLTTNRQATDFLYYTGGNPLFERPILDIGEGMYQVFEVKQVIHAINKLLERVCTATQADKTKYTDLKGKLLEDRVVELFSQFLKSGFKCYSGYFVDGKEQDILILWDKYAFIIEAKGYALNEPFRNPEKAFTRIRHDFNKSIGYGFEQALRVTRNFFRKEQLLITDKDGNLIEEIDTSKYEEEFAIIVNLESFEQVQCDLSSFIELGDEDHYPWAVKLDDLEIFLLMMMRQKRNGHDLVDFLMFRETLHEKLICSDELEICGGFLEGELDQERAEAADLVKTHPTLGNLFDAQYQKGMGFKNEKYLYEKISGKFLFW